MNVIFCNLCDQINGKCVDKIVSAADLPCTIAIANVCKFLHMQYNSLDNSYIKAKVAKTYKCNTIINEL